MSNELNLHTSNKTALIFGNTGLTGSFCEELLLKNTAYQKVISFGRKPVSSQGEKHLHHVIDFDQLEKYRELIKGDDLYLCIGTTLEQAGSKEAFYAVDYEINYNIAKIASENNVRQLLLVSAVGADPDSFFFYNRVKGELEEAIQNLTFWAIHIFQPSMILGERKESRPLEFIAQKIMKGADRLAGKYLYKYQPVSAQNIARAMVIKANSFKPGLHVYPSHVINKIVEENE